MSEKQTEPLIPPLDTLPRISLKGTEVVRRQYLSHIKDNLVSIRPDGIQFNTTCIRRMENVVHIQMMIDRKRKWLIVRECDEEDRDAQRWCVVKENERKPRKITGSEFAIRIYRMMGWNRGYYFRICGSFAVREDKEDELLLVFELEESEIYPMSSAGRKKAGVTDAEVGREELEKLNAYEAAKEAEKKEREEAKKAGIEPETAKKQTAFSEILASETFGETFENHVNRLKLPSSEDIDGQLDFFQNEAQDNVEG